MVTALSGKVGKRECMNISSTIEIILRCDYSTCLQISVVPQEDLYLWNWADHIKNSVHRSVELAQID